MQRELLPKIHEETLESYISHRFRSASEIERLESEMQDYLAGNEVLGNFIESMRTISDDPDSVIETAYGILSLIFAQREADELNEQAKLVYRDKISTSILDNYFAETSDFLKDSFSRRAGGRKKVR